MSIDKDQVIDTSKRDYGVNLLDSLADKASGNWTGKTDIAPSQLRIYFERSLYVLLNVRSKTLQESSLLENQCRQANSEFLTNIKHLSTSLSKANIAFKELDSKINEVSGKIIHLGDQLERKNAPRQSLKEARNLILEFSKFLGAGGGTFANVSAKLQSDESQLIEKAASIRTLSALCLELPDDERFLGAKQRVTVACQNLENLLVKIFRENFAAGNDEVMRQIAEVLVYSKSHSGCADVFIDETLKTLPADLGNLSTLPSLLAEAEKRILKIFFRPDTVVFHLIQVLFSKNLKSHLQSKVRLEMPSDIFLTNLYTEYCNLDRLVFQLIDRLQLISDETQLVKLLNGLVADLLSHYSFREMQWLKEHLTDHLFTYYASQGHTKRNISSGFSDLHEQLRTDTFNRLSELRREVTSRLNFFNDKEAALEGILLSQDVAVNMLDDVRQSAKRCLLLAPPGDRPKFGQKLYDMLATSFVTEHIDYGITLALQALNSTEPKVSDPKITFFAAVKEGSTLFNFFEKAVNEFIGPLFNGSPTHLQECASRRQLLQRSLEAKFSSGLERCLNLTLARVQAVFNGEQKKTDYKGDLSLASGNAFNGLPSASAACLHVSTFLQSVIKEARANLDGQNLVNIMNELGIRFHRLLVDHFYGYSFSDSGAFVAMQDVTAYRDVARDLQSPKIDYLFDILLKLMNLMLIKPQNVRQVWQDYEASGIPPDLLSSFLQLRTDYKTARLQTQIRRYLER